jgi:hypothetical protein
MRMEKIFLTIPITQKRIQLSPHIDKFGLKFAIFSLDRQQFDSQGSIFILDKL